MKILTLVLCLFASTAWAQQPNVLLVVADDLNFDTIDAATMPNLDRLASQSVRITGVHDVPRCRPALAGLLSGQYSATNGIWSNTVAGNLSPTGSLPNALLAAGYQTHCEGKYWEGDRLAMGFETWGPVTAPWGDPNWGRSNQTRAIRFIRQAKAVGEPFFLWYAPQLPHTPHDASQEYLDIIFPNPSAPAWFSGNQASYMDKNREYLANAYRFDESLGEILGTLELEGVADSTIVAFVSDNGWAVGALSKNAPSESGTRTPIYLRWPGTLTPVQHPEVVTVTSVTPTILDLCGVTIPTEMTAPSLQPIIDGSGGVVGPMFGAATHGNTTRVNDAFAIYARSQDGYLYRKWLKNPSGGYDMGEPGLVTIPNLPIGTEELFRVSVDPYELTELSVTEPEKLIELRDATAAWWGAAPPPPPLAAGTVIDDEDAGFATVGAWTHSDPAGPPGAYNGDVSYAPAGNGDMKATWTFAATGEHEVRITWNPFNNRSNDVPYRVLVDGVEIVAEDVNQRIAPDDVTSGGQSWEIIAVVDAVATIVVEMSNDTATGYVMADAAAIVELP